MEEDWNKALGRTISAIGTPELAAHLEQALSLLTDHSILMIFAYRGRSRPVAVHHNIDAQKATIVVDDYIRGPYLLDPFFEEVQRGRREGSTGLRQLAPDRFFKSEYYLKHYSRTGIRDELGIFAPLTGSVTAVASLTRSHDQPVFSARDRKRLNMVSPIIGAIVSSQWGRDHPIISAVPSENALEESLDGRLMALYKDVLTPRESEIITLILRGHSSVSMARLLEISPGTVKIHRKNAYRKLDISSQAQLFSLFLKMTETQ